MGGVETSSPSCETTGTCPLRKVAVRGTQAVGGGFRLEELPYGPGELEPLMDQETVLIHHGKHQQAYVNNLNAAVAR